MKVLALVLESLIYISVYLSGVYLDSCDVIRISVYTIN